MKPKTLMLLAVAGGCGLITMLGVQQALQGKSKAAEVPMVEVLVALTDIQVGVPLTEEKVTFKSMPATSAPEDAVRTKEEYDDRPLTYPALAGDVIRVTKLGPKGSHGQAANIPKGCRVVGIPVNDTQTVSGLIQPGDRVDVLVTYKGRDNRGANTSTTRTLLEYVEVFSVDARTEMAGGEQTETKAKVVSLIVKPDQAAFVKLAESKGTLALSWRHPEDDELVNVGGIDEKLLEELSGTIGYNEQNPLYAPQKETVPFVAEVPLVDEPPQTVHALLDGAATEPVAPAAVEPEARPTWSIDIYQKNTLTTQEFELPEPPAGSEDAAAEAASAIMTGALQKLFGG